MYFFDTYALYQILKNAPSYQTFHHSQGRTTLFNLYELHYILCKENNEHLAEDFIDYLLPFCLEITLDDIKTASHFRLANHKKGFSYVDALGYTIALKNGLIFLTGDDAFKGLEQVSFIK